MQAVEMEQQRDIHSFLEANGWGAAECVMIAGDASFRKYYRVTLDGKYAVLMDAPPPQEDVRPFVSVCRLLEQHGHSIPCILAEDAEHGFLLLHDLGDDSFTKHLVGTPDDEYELYCAAIDVLLEYKTIPANTLPPYEHAVLMREVKLFSEWFLPKVFGSEGIAELATQYNAIWEDILRAHPSQMNCFVHRDFHADNLMWLPENKNIQRVGQLDFQDALCGDATYDLVSLLEDARRDVEPKNIEKLVDYYVSQSGENRDDFMQRYALLGAQRNCKIIGIFTRLCVRDGKAHYLDYLPRVWRHLEHDIQHPVLAPLKKWMDEYILTEHRGVLSA